MNITITLDKSTFQSLNFKELLRLSNYFEHNIAPVLVMEILGDLKKEVAKGKAPSGARVKDFANKLFPIRTVVNAYYRSLIKVELSGHDISMDGRPSLGIEKFVQTEDGLKGSVIAETEEEKAIYKWKAGNFNDADHKLSKLWRVLTTREDILKNLQKVLQLKKNKRIKSFEELLENVNEALNDFEFQDRWLGYMINNYGDGKINGDDVFQRWFKEGRPPLAEFSPYVFHCLKVDLLFAIGLQSELIGTKPTNLVDIEYLYYIPFCNVFTSNDKIHKQLAPLLKRKDQQFIKGDDLKNDLKKIIEFFEKEGELAKKKFAFEPPIIKGSLTFSLWKKYFNYPEKSNMTRDLSEKELDYMKKQMDKFEKASHGEHEELLEGEEQNFIIKKSKLNINDPCLCGSGKRVINCCLPPKEFFKIIKEQAMNKRKN